VLKLVDQHGSLAPYEKRGICSRRIASREIVEVDDRPAAHVRQRSQQSGLPHRSRAFEYDHRLDREPVAHHIAEAPLDYL
jgi:hypothetical protein